jgi:two-component sensor histidine kinase
MSQDQKTSEAALAGKPVFTFVRETRLQRWGATLSVGVVLFIVSYLSDLLLFRLGIPAAKTILDNFVIGGVGAAAAYIWVRWATEREARFRERIILLIELNHHVRNALAVIHHSALLEDQKKKRELIEEAVDRIDYVLTELVPTVGTTSEPRLELQELDGTLHAAVGFRPAPQKELN